MISEKKQEFTRKITQANSTGLIVILYDMTLTFLEDALIAYEAENWKEYRKSIEGARSCLDELLSSLDLQYEIALRLHSLYFFFRRELGTAMALRNPEKIQGVSKRIKELKKSYEQVASQDTSAPLMENTQAVYAGLTYGKGSLNVDLADQSTNRGFRI